MRRSLALALVALAAGCIGKDRYEPGTALGTFHVTGKLQSNTCGATNAPDPWEFDVKLSRDVGTLYWIQGDAPVSGPLDSSSHVTMSSSASQNVDATKDGPGPCVLARDDALQATLTKDPADGQEVSAFAGSLTYTFHPGDGATDCSDQLASNGGGFAALPCSMTYTLTANRTALPNKYGK